MKNLGEQNLTVFEAGSDPDLWRDQRLEALRLCHYVFAWAPSRGDLWWADVAAAGALGKPVAIGAPDFVEGLPLLNAMVPFVVVSGVHSQEEAQWVTNLAMSHRCGAALSLLDAGDLAAQLEKCESPIEARLLVHLWQKYTDRFLHAEAQVTDDQYRIDMEVVGPLLRGGARLGIECDGHDFHERTREQAQRDKKRDRDLAARGWRILRFTGSEIWKDPARCAQEVFKVVESLAEPEEQ